MKYLFCLFLLVTTSSMGDQIINLESVGNLESTHKFNCISKEQYRNVYTPADAYPAIAKCLQKGKYSRAVDLYFIAGAYGYYDAFRVSDVSARQAVRALQANNIWGLEEKKRLKFKDELIEFSSDKESKTTMCQYLADLGKPNYHPSYMIQHGMKAFTGVDGNGLIQDYDSERIWNDALTKYLKCET